MIGQLDGDVRLGARHRENMTIPPESRATMFFSEAERVFDFSCAPISVSFQICFLFDGEISSNRIPKTKHVARNSGGRRTSPALKLVGWVAICRPDIRPSVRPPKPPLAQHRAAVVCSSRGPLLVPPASAEAEDGREAEGWGFGIPGFCSRFGSTFWAKLSYSIFLDSLTQVMQFQTSESQL